MIPKPTEGSTPTGTGIRFSLNSLLSQVADRRRSSTSSRRSSTSNSSPNQGPNPDPKSPEVFKHFLLNLATNTPPFVPPSNRPLEGRAKIEDLRARRAALEQKIETVITNSPTPPSPIASVERIEIRLANGAHIIYRQTTFYRPQQMSPTDSQRFINPGNRVQGVRFDSQEQRWGFHPAEDSL